MKLKTYHFSKLYLFHQTAKEFLVSTHNSDPRETETNHLLWKSSLRPAESHRVLCMICIWHLLFTEFVTHPLDGWSLDQKEVSDYIDEHVFLEYSTTCWAAYFRPSGIKDGVVVDSLQRICDADSARCFTWFTIYWRSTHTGFIEDSRPS